MFCHTCPCLTAPDLHIHLTGRLSCCQAGHQLQAPDLYLCHTVTVLFFPQTTRFHDHFFVTVSYQQAGLGEEETQDKDTNVTTKLQRDNDPQSTYLWKCHTYQLGNLARTTWPKWLKVQQLFQSRYIHIFEFNTRSWIKRGGGIKCLPAPEKLVSVSLYLRLLRAEPTFFGRPIMAQYVFTTSTTTYTYTILQISISQKINSKDQYFWQTYKSTLKIDSKGHYFWQTYNGPICVHNIYILQTNQPPYLHTAQFYN